MNNTLIENTLSGYTKEVTEIILLDQLWMTTGDHEYALKCENKLHDLAEKVTYDVYVANNIDQVQNIIGDIIEEQKQRM